MGTKHKNPIIIEPSEFTWKELKEIYEDKAFGNDLDYRMRNTINKVPRAIMELLFNLNKRVEELEYQLKNKQTILLNGRYNLNEQ